MEFEFHLKLKKLVKHMQEIVYYRVSNKIILAISLNLHHIPLIPQPNPPNIYFSNFNELHVKIL